MAPVFLFLAFGFVSTDPGPSIEGYLDLDQFQEGIVENEEDLIEEDIEEDS